MEKKLGIQKEERILGIQEISPWETVGKRLTWKTLTMLPKSSEKLNHLTLYLFLEVSKHL